MLKHWLVKKDRSMDSPSIYVKIQENFGKQLDQIIDTLNEKGWNLNDVHVIESASSKVSKPLKRFIMDNI